MRRQCTSRCSCCGSSASSARSECSTRTSIRCSGTKGRYIADLDLATYGFTPADLDTDFDVGSFKAGTDRMRLADLVAALQATYCRTFGAEYMYISDTPTKRFIQQRLEPIRARPTYSAAEQRHILERLTAAETLERYLHTKYVGQKRFSGEGGLTMIPMLDHLIQRAGALGVQETVIGMAHRGRLNVLVNTLGKMPADLFSEFEGKQAQEFTAGDVKYHQGFSSDVVTPGGPMHLTLAFNPSHLEAVNPVVEGSVRARQHRRGDAKGDTVLPVLIHGDAAVAGQGVMQEVLNMAQTRGFYTGGTIHLVVNNQIGFTTSDPRDTPRHDLLHRHREDVGSADPARQRRRSGGLPARDRDRARLPAAIPQGRLHRSRLLPAPRAQRGRRAHGDAAAHVQEDSGASRHAAALRRKARRGRRGQGRTNPRR